MTRATLKDYERIHQEASETEEARAPGVDAREPQLPKSRIEEELPVQEDFVDPFVRTHQELLAQESSAAQSVTAGRLTADTSDTLDPFVRVHQELLAQEMLDAPPAEDAAPSLIKSAGRGVTHGVLGLAESVNTGVQWLGNRVGSETMTDIGRVGSSFWRDKAEKFAPSKNIEGKNVWDNPELLKTAEWWVYNVSDMLPSLAASIIPGMGAMSAAQKVTALAKLAPKIGMVVGGLTGGALEGAQTYQAVLAEGGTEDEAARSAELMTVGAGILNALSVGKVLETASTSFMSKVKKHLGAAVWEGITEGLEEPTEVFAKYFGSMLAGEELPTNLGEQLVDSLKDALTVAPIAAVAGGGGSVVASAISPAEALTDKPDAAAVDQSNQKELENIGKFGETSEAAQNKLAGIRQDLESADPESLTLDQVEELLDTPEHADIRPQLQALVAEKRAQAVSGAKEDPTPQTEDMLNVAELERKFYEDPLNIDNTEAYWEALTAESEQVSQTMAEGKFVPAETLRRHPDLINEADILEDSDRARATAEEQPGDERGIFERTLNRIADHNKLEGTEREEFLKTRLDEFDAQAAEEAASQKRENFAGAINYIADKQNLQGAEREAFVQARLDEFDARGQAAQKPLEPSPYFKEAEGAEVVPLKTIRAREPLTTPEQREKLERSKELMTAAAEGTGEKRAPITVYEREDGVTVVVDGNTTYHALQELGEKNIPVVRVPALTQPASSIEEVYAQAEAARGDIKKVTEKIAKDFGGTAHFRPGGALKSKSRAQEKVTHEYGSAAKLKDVLASTVSFADQTQVSAALEGFLEDGAVVEVKNRIENVPTSGYRDISMVVRMPNGHLAEIQLTTDSMFEAKNAAGHVMYELFRELETINVPGAREVQAELNKLSREYYDAAFTDPANFNALSSDIGIPLYQIFTALPDGIRTRLSPSSLNNLRDLLSKTKGVPSESKKVSDIVSPPSTEKVTQPDKGVKRKKGKENDLRTTEQRDASKPERRRAQRQKLEETAARFGAAGQVETVVPTTRAQKAFREVAALFGIETVFFKTDNTLFKSVGGFTDPRVPGEIYVNTENQKPMEFLVGHETLHQLRARHPDLYDFLVNTVIVPDKNFRAYVAKHLKNWKGSEATEAEISTALEQNKDYIMEELLADFTGDQFKSPVFWEKMGKRNPSFTRRIIDVIKEIIDKIKFSLTHGTQYIENFEASQAALVEAMNVFAREQAAQTALKFSKQSTRVPSAKSATENALDSLLVIDYNVALNDTASLEKNAEFFKSLPNLRPTKAKAETVVENMVRHMVDNILWVYDQVPKNVRDRARLWYDGANKIAKHFSKKYGISDMQSAGVIAVMSPNNEWFQNVSVAERVLDIVSTRQNFEWSPAMTRTFKDSGLPGSMREVKGKKLKDVLSNPKAAAKWVRTYDQTYNDRSKNLILPEGGTAGTMMTATGKPAATAWGPYGEISKAVSILMDGRAENVHYQLGNSHKVRNFYNNIYDPSSDKFVTIDTHAVGVSFLQSFGGEHPVVKHAFGSGASSSVTGLHGSYVYHVEAYKRAAAKLGILPREMQSIVWVGKQSLFGRNFKGGSKNEQAVTRLWHQYNKGKLTQAEVRAGILEVTGGLSEQAWWSETYNDKFETSYPKDEATIKKLEKFPRKEIQVAFEVAPHPDNAALQTAWAGVTEAQRAEISQIVAAEITPKILQEFSTSGEFQLQVGGYAGAGNVGFGLRVENSALAVPIAKMLGYSLSQKEMVVASDKKIPGTDKVDIITIELPEGYSVDKTHKLYYDLYELTDSKGNRLVEGHTTANGKMAILNFTGLNSDALKQRIKKRLEKFAPAENFKISADEGFSALINEKEYEYDGYRPRTAEEVAAGSPVLRRPDRFRKEASERLAEELRKAGVKFSRSGELGRVREGEQEADRAGSQRADVQLTHYGRTKGLKKLDPAYHGQGLIGAESKRKAADPAHWVDRTYYGLPGYKKEPGLGSEKYTASLPTEELYDFVKDPDGLKPKVQEIMKAAPGWPPNSINVYEQLIFQAGYSGYTVGEVAAVFKALEVTPDAKFSKAPPVETKAFKDWFGKSEITNPDGSPRVVYHGTKELFTEFKATKYDDQLIFFSTNPEFASQWASSRQKKPEALRNFAWTEKNEKELQVHWAEFHKKSDALYESDKAEWTRQYDELRRTSPPRKALIESASDAAVYPTYIKAEKMFHPEKDFELIEDTLRTMSSMHGIMKEGRHKEGHWIVYENKEVIDKIKSLGYDGIWLRESALEGSAFETIAVWNPSQIKSAIGNVGTFDPANPDIRFSKSPTQMSKDIKRAFEGSPDLYNIYVSRIDSGPLDGGCYACAKAIQETFGGELRSLYGRVGGRGTLQPQHIVVEKDGLYFDAEGGKSAPALLKHWEEKERISDGELRPFRETDIPDSPRDRGLVDITKQYLQPSAEARVSAAVTEGKGGVTRLEYRNDAGIVVGQARLSGTTIGDIEVKAKFRRQGYGDAIVRDLVSRGGAAAVPISKASKSLFERAGFQKSSGGYYRLPSDAQTKFSKTPWPEDFPNATLHTSLSKLRNHPEYKKAKSGDISAALQVVSDTIKPEKIEALYKEHPDAIVVAPHAEEAAGRNALPQVLAEVMHQQGFQVDTDIVQANTASRTDKDSVLRLVVRPEFDGHVVNGGKYILIDDAVGQGGTLSELRDFIERNGGEVVHISALTAGIYGAKISITAKTIREIETKFGREQTEEFLHENNIAGNIESLTEKEGRTVLGFSSLNALRDRITSSAQKANIQLLSKTPPQEVTPDQLKFSKTDPELTRAGQAEIDRIITRLRQYVKKDEMGVSESKTRKLASQYVDLKKKLVDRHLATETKIKEFKSLLMQMPIHVRGKSLAGFNKLATVKNVETKEKYFQQIRAQAEKDVHQYFRQETLKAINKMRKLKIKSKGHRKSNIGAPAARVLEYINTVLTDSKLRTVAGQEELIARLQTRLAALEGKETTHTIERQIQNTKDKIEVAEIFGAYGEATLADLEHAHSTLEKLIMEGRTMWQQVEAARKATTSELTNKVIRDVTGEENPTPETPAEKRRRESKEDKSTWFKIKRGLSNYDTLHQSWHFLMDKISTRGEGRTLRTQTVERLGGIVQAATNREAELNQTAVTMIQNKLSELTGLSGRKLEKWINDRSNAETDYNIVSTDRNGRKLQETIPLSDMQAAYWWALNRRGAALAAEGTDSVVERLELMGVTPKFLNQVEKTVDPSVLDLAEWLSRTMGDHIWQNANQVHELRYGASIPNSLDYTPIWADYNKGRSEADLLQRQSRGSSMVKGALHDLTSTKMGVKPANLLDVWTNHINDMNHFTAWAIPVQQLEGVFGNQALRNFIEQHYGKEMNGKIGDFIEIFKGAPAIKKDHLSNMAVWRGRFSTAVLGLNPAIYLKQLTSIPAMAADIPTMAWNKGVASFMANPMKAIRTLNESQFVKTRHGSGHTRDVAAAAVKDLGKLYSGGTNLQTKLMFLVRMGDLQAIYVGGWPVYKYYKDKYSAQGMSAAEAHKKALARFEQTALQTQQTGEKYGMGLIQQGSAFQQLFTMFMSAPVSYYREVGAAVRNMKKAPGDSLKRLGLFWIVVPAMFSAIANAPLAFDDDDEDQALFWKRLGRDIILGPINGLFLARDAVTYMYNSLFLQQENWSGLGFSSMGQPVETTGKLLKKIADFAGGEDMDWAKFNEDVIDIAGYVTGLPTPAAQNYLQGLNQIRKGETEHPVAKVLGYTNWATGDRREDVALTKFAKQKRRVKEIADGLDKADDKTEYRRKHAEDLRLHRQIQNLQPKLNKLQRRINELKEREGTEKQKALIETLEQRRTELVRQFLNRQDGVE